VAGGRTPRTEVTDGPGRGWGPRLGEEPGVGLQAGEQTRSGGVAAHTWLTDLDCDLDEFRALVERTTDLAAYPRARAVESNVLVYDAKHLRQSTRTDEDRLAVQAELVRALLDGPGVVLFEGAFDPAVVDRATAVFTDLMDEEIAAGTSRGDHFAKPGTNARLWDSLSKLAGRDADVFVDYFANDVLALISVAWLGPGYQVTSQVNLVNPGGVAQSVHRDYHLGFMSNDQAALYPAHVHQLSPALTLQGAVAHSDMPVESGPTLYVPYSQQYPAGYLAWRLPKFCEYGEKHHVQLPLAKGDAAFFNPALFHAAGHNRSSDVHRMANLLQISSAFGRAMESIDREALVNVVYRALLQRKRAGAKDEWIRNAVAACAEGYAFPTNLDLDAPVEGLAPPAPADIVLRALAEDREPEALRHELRAAAERRQG
jgi:ectoine hydroxylase-related dioxygenase (phytanoyl-CoA dioxygenase family)